MPVIPRFTEFTENLKTGEAPREPRLPTTRAKNVKTYLTHFPVKSYHEADLLSRETTWRIMDHIRQSGAQGITAADITVKEKIPSSVVYSTLKELYRLEFVFLYPRDKKRKGERMKRFVCERCRTILTNVADLAIRCASASCASRLRNCRSVHRA